MCRNFRKQVYHQNTGDNQTNADERENIEPLLEEKDANEGYKNYANPTPNGIGYADRDRFQHKTY